MKEKKHGMALRLWWWGSFAVFLVCVLFALYYVLQSIEQKQQNQELAAYVAGADDTPATTVFKPDVTDAPIQAYQASQEVNAAQTSKAADAQPVATQKSELTSRLQSLAQQNPDFIGWLSVSDTNINEPVMYTPNDSQYYLNRDFNGAYASAGQLFMDASCNTGNVPGNKIIYGHNMRDGSRFADLKRYLDKDFFTAQPYIQFDTVSGSATYKVMAAMKLEVGESSPAMLCYQNIDTTDAAALETLKSYLTNYAALRNESEQPQPDDELLTLSTCGRVGSNERVVVMARRVQAKP